MTTLLPHATPLEGALEASIAARLALPFARVTTTWSPTTCPADQLGFLAWQLSIDLWDDAWPEVKKRAVCAQAIDLHRSKTTLAGIRRHVALVDSEVRAAIRPPARGFWKSAITDAARAAQLAALPQIRLYPFAHDAIAYRRWFPAAAAARRSFHGHAWLRATRGPSLTGTRATFWQSKPQLGGVEIPIALDQDGDAIRALIPATRPGRSWYGHGFNHGDLAASRGADDVLAFRASSSAASFAVSRGTAPVDVAPTRIFAGRIAPRHRSFLGRPLRFLQRSAAPLLVYDRISIADPSVDIARRRVRTWHGHGRFGIGAYTAELSIAVPMHRPRLAFDRWHGRGFLKRADFSALARTIEAVRVAKAARDTIRIDTASHAGAAFAPGLTFGDDFTFGTRMRKF
ncbi:phage tail protein I [Sphingomonas oligophenolica]|uniref:Phage tail protein I n=1 Tax=Sphingomonas oligophenolica TaxID=301154 RepID=A0A502CNF8_9SPHN|nr:phage tail protein I [Sphingomonas oligophenolica]TPG14363.1 phage tail protein I [Sphingomonas oligophenolica]